ncbi:MFS transporter [Leptolyngbya sp. AN02str]|uniref:MFS transporter n=1 Tax=Leptolyngbya sp. AN02str TaxID=3423363 RepID=UPI003D30F747
MTNSLEAITDPPSQEGLDTLLTLKSSALNPQSSSIKFSKEEIRSSLRASTWDGVFATLFTNITGGVLISNFLVELEANPIQIGMLASIPMLANLLQPVGAYFADRTTSRRRYGLWVYGASRVLWLPLAIAIIFYSNHPNHPQHMILATLAVMLLTHGLGAIGSASWLSWLATLVPKQLRGRYFGFRNSAFSLTNLIALPLLGVMVSRWMGGSFQGFGVMVIVAVVAGLISLGFQSRMTDVNPQGYWAAILNPTLVVPESGLAGDITDAPSLDGVTAQELTRKRTVITDSVDLAAIAEPHNMFGDVHFLLFLLYFAVWAFGLNLCNPFFNIYLLDNLALDLGWVTLYNALGAGATLLMLLFWGKLADRIGNRSILLLVGVMVAVLPLLWLGADASALSVWLWFPLLHILGGGTGAAIDLCINNLQLAIAPVQHQTKYFATLAAIGGVAGAMGAMVGGWLAQSTDAVSIPGLFALSSVLRLVALLPLVWVQEPQRRSLKDMLKRWFSQLKQPPTHSIPSRLCHPAGATTEITLKSTLEDF